MEKVNICIINSYFNKLIFSLEKLEIDGIGIDQSFKNLKSCLIVEAEINSAVISCQIGSGDSFDEIKSIWISKIEKTEQEYIHDCIHWVGE